MGPYVNHGPRQCERGSSELCAVSHARTIVYVPLLTGVSPGTQDVRRSRLKMSCCSLVETKNWLQSYEALLVRTVPRRPMSPSIDEINEEKEALTIRTECIMRDMWGSPRLQADSSRPTRYSQRSVSFFPTRSNASQSVASALAASDYKSCQHRRSRWLFLKS